MYGMRWSIFGVAMLVVLCLGRPIAGASVPGYWHDNLQAALADGNNTGRPIFALFAREGCGACDAMENNLALPGSIAALDQMVKVRIEIADFPELAEKYAAKGTPTTIIFLSAEADQPDYEYVGAMSPDVIMALGNAVNSENVAALNRTTDSSTGPMILSRDGEVVCDSIEIKRNVVMTLAACASNFQNSIRMYDPSTGTAQTFPTYQILTSEDGLVSLISFHAPAKSGAPTTIFTGTLKQADIVHLVWSTGVSAEYVSSVPSADLFYVGFSGYESCTGPMGTGAVYGGQLAGLHLQSTSSCVSEPQPFYAVAKYASWVESNSTTMQAAVDNYSVSNPVPPKNFQVTATGSQSISLAWTPQGSASEYVLAYQQGAAPVNCTGAGTKLNLNSDVSQYTVTGLTPSTGYGFALCGKSGTKISSAYTITGATTQGGEPAPLPPTGVVVSAERNTVNAAWNSEPGLAYRVKIQEGSVAGDCSGGELRTSPVSFSNLYYNTLYTVAVCALRDDTLSTPVAISVSTENKVSSAADYVSAALTKTTKNSLAFSLNRFNSNGADLTGTVSFCVEGTNQCSTQNVIFKKKKTSVKLTFKKLASDTAYNIVFRDAQRGTSSASGRTLSATRK